jgi:hypothetical protein
VEIDGQGGGGSLKKERGGGVGATTQGQATTKMDNTTNNHTERGTGWSQDGGSNGNDGGLSKCKGTTVNAVGGMATIRRRRGQS